MIPRYLLPPTAYTSVAWFEQEQAALFGPRWALVGCTDDLGDAPLGPESAADAVARSAVRGILRRPPSAPSFSEPPTR